MYFTCWGYEPKMEIQGKELFIWWLVENRLNMVIKAHLAGMCIAITWAQGGFEQNLPKDDFCM